MSCSRLKQGILALAIIVAIMLTLVVPAETATTPIAVTITPIADATVNSSLPDTNLGSDETLYVQFLSRAEQQRALIQFDLSGSYRRSAVPDSEKRLLIS